MPNYQVEVDVVGKLNAGQINALLRTLKTSLGSFGDGIQLLDEKKLREDLRGLEAEAKTLQKELADAATKSVAEFDRLDDSVKKVSKGGAGLGKAFQLNQITQSIRNVADSVASLQGPMVDLDKQVRNIGTLGRAGFQEFSDLALNMSKTIPNSAAEIAGAAYDAISAGITGTNQQIADFVANAAKLGVAGLTTTGDAVNSLTSILNSYGLGADQAGRISDELFNIVNAGKVSVPELNSALAAVLPTAAAAGVSFAQLGGAIATFTKQGVPANQAATKLNALLVELQKPGAALSPILTKANVSIASLKADGLQETMRKVGVALQESGTSAIQAFSSIEAGGAALLLTGEKAVGAGADFEYVRDTIGSTQNAFEIASDGIGVKTELIKNKFNAFVTQGLQQFGSGINVAIAGISQLAPALVSISQIKTLVPDAAFDSIGKLITTKVLPAILTLIPGYTAAGAAGATSGAVAGSAWIAALAPLLPVILGIGALVGLFVLLYNKSASFKAAVQGIFESIVGALEKGWALIEPILSDLGGLLVDIGGLILTFMILPWQIAFEIIAKVGGAIVEGISSIPGASAVFDALSFVVDKVRLGIIGLKAAIAGVTAVIGSVVGSVGDFFGALVSGDISGAVDSLSNLGSDAGDAFVVAAGESINESMANLNLEKGRKALEDQMQLKQSVDKAGKLDELVVKLKAAKTEAERNDISATIAKSYPKAVKEIKTFVDESGKVQTVYSINEKAVEKFGDKARDAYGDDLKQRQVDAIGGLQAQLALYDQSKVKLGELGDKLAEKKALGLDTTDAQKEFDDFKGEVEKGKTDVEENLKSLDSSGLLKNLPPEAQAAFNAVKKQNQSTFDDLEAKARETKLGDIISKSAVISGDIDKNDELGKLLEKFKNTKAGVEKDNLAAVIAQQAPGAVSGMKTVVDANGEIKTVYQINEQKANDFFKANSKIYDGKIQDQVKDFISALAGQADEFERNKDAAAKLSDRIVEGVSKNQDVSKLKEEYSKLQGKISDNAAALAKTVEQGKKFKLIKGDVKNVGTEMGLTKRQADGIAEASRRIKTATDSAATSAAKLGEEFDKAKKAADAGAQLAVSQLAQALSNWEVAQRSNNDTQKKLALEALAAARKYGKEQIDISRNIGKFQEQAETELGLKKKERVKTEKKDAIDAAKEVDEAIRDLTNDARVAGSEGLDQSLEQLLIQFESEKKALLEAAQKLRADTADKTKRVLNAGRIKDLEEGGRAQLLLQAKFDRLAREAKLKFYGSQLSEEQKAQQTLLQFHLDALKNQEDQISGDDEAALSERLSKRLQIISLQQALELEQFVTGNAAYIDEYGKLQVLREQFDSATTDAQRAALQDQINQQQSALGQLRQDLILHNGAALGIQQKYNFERTKAEAEILDRAYQVDLKRLEEKQRKETALLQRQAEASKRIIADVEKFAQKVSDALIASEKDDDLKRLEEKHRLMLLSNESFEAEKQRLEERAAARSEAFQARLLGAQVEAERQAALQSLLIQQSQLEAKRQLAIESGNVEEANSISGQLDDLAGQIEEKGSVLTSLTGELQGNLTEGFTNLLGGQEAAIKEPFRKAFSVIAGALQRLASAKVYETLLGSINGIGGIPALLASFALKPIIESIMQAALGPLFDKLLSFPTGGRFDGPTLALIGDASRLGGTDREWLFRDEQLKDLLTAAVAGSAVPVVEAIQQLAVDLQTIQVELYLRGEDLSTATQRHEQAQNRRVVGRRSVAT